jgi:hypothetical protein
MRDLSKGILVCIACLTAGATAQERTVRTQGGTPGTVPVFTREARIGDSVITQNGGQVGIGTTNDSPYDPLMVLSDPALKDGGGIGMTGVVIPAENDYAFAESNYWLTNPAAATPNVFLFSFGAEGEYSDSGELTNVDAYIYDPRGVGIYNLAVDGSDNVYIGGTGYLNSPSTLALFAGANGNVGLGTNTPGARLEVNGSILLTKGGGGSITFADGTTQTTAYTGVTNGGDYAESVDVTGDRMKYEPGDVLVIDSSSPGKFLKSAEPYSTSVTGIYSTKPGTVGRRQATPRTAEEVPMAMMGIVPTNVTAENGPIRPGDLLVTSSSLGYAMKGTDRNRMLGAVIGKALGSLDSGKGVIEVVVTLQ